MMRTSVDVALGKPQAPPEVAVLGAKLEEGLDQADKLLEGLLVLARAQRGALGEISEVSLPDLVFAALVAEQDEIRRRLTVLDGTFPAEVMGNETLLARLVANIVNNAVRHNVADGIVVISNGNRDGMAYLMVDSGGPVLDKEAVQDLAQPFRRLGRAGGGQQGGGTGALDRAGHRRRPRGCPGAPGSARGWATRHRQASGGSTGMRVLVIEDVRRLADDIAEGLRDQGIAADVAYDGLEAVGKLGVNLYDVVVLDRDLPGLHGDLICQMIADGERAVMVLMLTASGHPATG